jgi:hypothetical protein
MISNYYLSIFLIIIIIIIFFIVNILCKKSNNLNKNNILFESFKYEQNNKYCCIYAYYEKDDLYKENFIYFLKNGILDNVDYYIVLNGNCTVNIPQKNNIIVYQRENKGYDFGAFSYVINKFTKKYDYYFFLNTSICGPYLNNNDKKWIYYFLELFNKDKDVKIVGTSINIYRNNYFEKYNLTKIYNKNNPFIHIQSMFFCIDNEYFNYLKNINFFNEDEVNNVSNIHYIIAYKEIGLSQHALNNNWNINCILSKYKDIDYRNLKKDINNTSYEGDPYYENSYFGKNIDKYEVIFYKNNRFKRPDNYS